MKETSVEMNFETLINQNDATIKLVIEYEFPDKRCVGGKYVPSTNSIFLFEHDIEIQCRQMFGSLEHLDSYRWIVFGHELGHALDPELSFLSKKLEETGDAYYLYKIEENAWNIAEDLLSFIERGIFQKVRQKSLAVHTKKVQNIS